VVSFRQEVRVSGDEAEQRQRFEALFSSYSSDVVAYCRWRAASASDAQDAAAEVFLTAWRRLDELPRGDGSRVWLYATARRVIANQRRSRRRLGALHERLALEVVSTPQDERPPDPDQARVREALRRLGPIDREVLLLAEWEGLSSAQIAGVLGCRAVTARGRLHRARRRFRAAFEELVAREDVQRPRAETRPAVMPRPATHVRKGGA
jgi:RNA polymerase sigma factor (sigma-70 family)